MLCISKQTNNKQTNKQTDKPTKYEWTLCLTLSLFSHGKTKAGTHTTNKQTNKLQY